jgi:hypothetical protein
MDIKVVLEEAGKVVTYLNANLHDYEDEDGVKALLETYFETNRHPLEIDHDCVSYSCDYAGNEFTIYLHVVGEEETSVILSTRELINMHWVWKKDGSFFVSRISDRKCDDVWCREYDDEENFTFQYI